MYSMYFNDMNCDNFFNCSGPENKVYTSAPFWENAEAFSAQISSSFLRQMALSAAAATVKRR